MGQTTLEQPIWSRLWARPHWNTKFGTDCGPNHIGAANLKQIVGQTKVEQPIWDRRWAHPFWNSKFGADCGADQSGTANLEQIMEQTSLEHQIWNRLQARQTSYNKSGTFFHPKPGHHGGTIMEAITLSSPSLHPEQSQPSL